MAINLVNLETGTLDFGKGPVLDAVSLGVAAGERIGVVGRNGGGKSTLLSVLAGRLAPHSGRLTQTASVRIGYLGQSDNLNNERTVRETIFDDQPEHQWLSSAKVRSVLNALTEGESWLERKIGTLSGGQRRRVDLARLLVDDLDLLLLDEPTNHLDVEAIAWLAAELKSRKQLAAVVVTHDRWFLDEISDQMWEVINGKVESYEGGYSAFTLAKAERIRNQEVVEARRQNLLRKELAWLRRGAPARTSKPKFRIDAANELIEGEPAPRDSAGLLAFSKSRLGKTVFECHDLEIGIADRVLLDRLTWHIGPGDRIGILGANGSGKSTLLRTLAGEHSPRSGKLVTGKTVKCAHLSQHLPELDPSWRLIDAIERIALRVELGNGKELSASQLAERLGFPASAQWTYVGDLSGGERRRLQLTRLLMTEPNVLILDEPTNDFDTETLASLEDLLDGFAGTLIVVSHDRYFLERVCERQVGLLGDGKLTDLPGGVDDYLQRVDSTSPPAPTETNSSGPSDAALAREARKELVKVERNLNKLTDQIAKLHAEMAVIASDYAAVGEIAQKAKALEAEHSELEERWLELAAIVESK